MKTTTHFFPKALLRLLWLSLLALPFAHAADTATTSPTDPATPAAQDSPLPRVSLETSKGTIVLELNRQKAPLSTENFLNYVREGFYEGTLFHRTIPGFMIQGGGFARDFTQKPTRDPIRNESSNGLRNLRGTIAMARTSAPHSATAQFFINVVDNDFLDYRAGQEGYAVFGKVVEGMNVVDAIVAARTANRGPHQNVPVEPIEILKAVIVQP